MKNLYILIMAVMAVMAGGTVYAVGGKTNSGTVSAADAADTVNSERSIEPFTAIDVSAVANVVYTQGGKPTMRIAGTRRLADNLQVEQHDGTLVLKNKERKTYNNFNFEDVPASFGKSEHLTVYVTSPHIERVWVSSVGSFHCTGTVKADDLRIRLSGVGSVVLNNVSCMRFAAELSGVGRVSADKVEARVANVESKGAGAMKLSLYGVERVYLAQSGVGNTNVNFDGCGALSCDVSGIGTVTLGGTVQAFENTKTGMGTLNTDNLKVAGR